MAQAVGPEFKPHYCKKKKKKKKRKKRKGGKKGRREGRKKAMGRLKHLPRTRAKASSTFARDHRRQDTPCIHCSVMQLSSLFTSDNGGDADLKAVLNSGPFPW
jgi:hypothetical protein